MRLFSGIRGCRREFAALRAGATLEIGIRSESSAAKLELGTQPYNDLGLAPPKVDEE